MCGSYPTPPVEFVPETITLSLTLAEFSTVYEALAGMEHAFPHIVEQLTRRFSDIGLSYDERYGREALTEVALAQALDTEPVLA